MEVTGVHQSTDKYTQTGLMRAAALDVLDTLVLGHKISVLLQLTDVHVKWQLQVDLADPLEVGVHTDPFVALLPHHVFFLGGPVFKLPVLDLLWCVEDVAKTVQQRIIASTSSVFTSASCRQCSFLLAS